MSDRPTLPDVVTESGIIAVVRSPSVDESVVVAQRLVASGVRAIELTLTTPDLLDEWESVVQAVPDDVVLGVGTVTSPEEAARAADLGAAFIVTPAYSPDALAVCVDAGVPAIGGAMTPSEILATWRAGAAAVKVFPAATVGPDYLAHVRAPFPELQLVPSGGIALDAIGRWIRAGAVAVCLGGPLVGTVGVQSAESLRQRAAIALAAVVEARAGAG